MGPSSLCLIFSLLALSVPASLSAGVQSWKWTHDMNLPSGLDVKWIVGNEEYMTMQIFAPTQGYIGVGFSPGGGMRGADIIMGWIDNEGVPHLKDYYGTHNGVPLEDPQQDVELLEAEQNDQGTRFVFRRKWSTCDEKHDIVIGADTMKFIWAWSETDPVDNQILHWHGKGLGRGARGIFMKHQGIQRGFPDEDPNYATHPHIKHWDIRMDKYIVPQVDTNYQCKIFKLPALTKKHHVIAHRPLLTTESEKYVHHINVYKCHVPEGLGKSTSQVFEQYLTHPGADCYASDTPGTWKQYCMAFIVAFAIGSEGDILPDYLGDPVEPPADGGDIYIKMEVHYDNPLRLPLNDSSGVRLFYTDELRQYETAMFITGHRRTPFLSIPPHQDQFKISGFCSSDCTRNGLPATGMKIYSVLLHAHLSGRRIILRHIRDGKELPPIAEDNNYDFSYQQYRFLREEVTVLPGDELIVECDFNTTDKDDFVYGGLSTRREMCESFMYYYPKTTMLDCRSQPEFYSYFNGLGIENVSGSVLNDLALPYNPSSLPEHLRDLSPADDAYILEYGQAAETTGDIFEKLQVTSPNDKALKYKTVHEEMNSLDWGSETVPAEIQKKWINGPQYMHCARHSGKRIDINGAIKYIQPYEPYIQEKSPHAQCLGQSYNGGQSVGFSMLLTFAAAATALIFLS